MSKRWYAVQHGDEYACDWGSTVKREAIKMANRLKREYPDEEIRIVFCRTDDNFAEDEIVIQYAADEEEWRNEEKEYVSDYDYYYDPDACLY